MFLAFDFFSITHCIAILLETATTSKDITLQNFSMPLCEITQVFLSPPVNKKYSSLLDIGVIDDDDYNDNKGWTIDQGITPDMINKICIELVENSHV